MQEINFFAGEIVLVLDKNYDAARRSIAQNLNQIGAGNGQPATSSSSSSTAGGNIKIVRPKSAHPTVFTAEQRDGMNAAGLSFGGDGSKGVSEQRPHQRFFASYNGVDAVPHPDSDTLKTLMGKFKVVEDVNGSTKMVEVKKSTRPQTSKADYRAGTVHGHPTKRGALAG